MALNRVMLIGNAGKDPEIRFSGDSGAPEGRAVHACDDREVQGQGRQSTGADRVAQHRGVERDGGHRREVRQEGLAGIHRGQAEDEVVGGERAEILPDGGDDGEDTAAGRQAGDGAGRTAGGRIRAGREIAAGAAAAATAGRDGQPVLSATAAGHDGGARDELCAADGRPPFLA